MTKLVTLLIPCYNEESSLPLLYEALRSIIHNIHYQWEILFIDDGSLDGTINQIKILQERDSRISYLELSRNFGKECAMLAGFDYAKGDCIIILDADLQDPPALIPEMLSYWEQGYEDVYAKRRSRGKESWLRKRLSLAYYHILQKSTRVEVLQNVGDFRLLDRKCIEALKQIRESERYTKGMYCWIGFKKKEILFDRADRIAGKSSFNFKSLFNLGIEGITSFTTAPLRFSTILGIIISLCAFIMMLFFVLKKLIWGDPVQGFSALISVTLFLGGIQLLSLGIIGEYIGRIFNETKGRPVYIVKEYCGMMTQNHNIDTSNSDKKQSCTNE